MSRTASAHRTWPGTQEALHAHDCSSRFYIHSQKSMHHVHKFVPLETEPSVLALFPLVGRKTGWEFFMV